MWICTSGHSVLWPTEGEGSKYSSSISRVLGLCTSFHPADQVRNLGSLLPPTSLTLCISKMHSVHTLTLSLISPITASYHHHHQSLSPVASKLASLPQRLRLPALCCVIPKVAFLQRRLILTLLSKNPFRGSVRHGSYCDQNSSLLPQKIKVQKGCREAHEVTRSLSISYTMARGVPRVSVI